MQPCDRLHDHTVTRDDDLIISFILFQHTKHSVFHCFKGLPILLSALGITPVIRLKLFAAADGGGCRLINLMLVRQPFVQVRFPVPY